MDLLRSAARKAAHWLLPLTCCHCAEDLPEGAAGPLCAPCAAAAFARPLLSCRRCDVSLPDGGALCRPCRSPRRSPLAGIRAAALYTPEVRSVVRACKYGSRRELARPMAAWLNAALVREPALRLPDALVPVPLHPARRRARGFNQALEMAMELSRRAGVPVREVLSRERPTAAQADLDQAQRLANVAGAFRARRGAGLGRRRVLLIDDVATTGATLEACALELRKVGVREVFALVVARQVRAGL